MDKLVLFNSKDLKSFLKKRSRESKFGEHVQLFPNLNYIYDDLVNLDVDYVVFGVKDDVGVYANYGKPGTSKAWEAALKVLLNIQSNHFTYPKRVLILGCLDFSKTNEKLSVLNQNHKKSIAKLREKVEKIDQHVSNLILDIVKSGKIPIMIGGGHNNAYGAIKGTSLALKKPINAINFDAHTDFREEEGRHSGNGFSYASSEGFLKNYFVFGLHENYTSEAIFNTIQKQNKIQYCTYEAIEVRKETKFKIELERAQEHIAKGPFGLEIDCDAIENIPSSAMTPSGFSVSKARRFVHFYAKNKNIRYVHICEAAPTPETETHVGKLITYLITDFIRAHGN